MTKEEILKQIREFNWKKICLRARSMLEKNPVMVFIGVTFSLWIIYSLMSSPTMETVLTAQVESSSFQNGRILNNQEGPFYRGQERLLAKRAQAIADGQQKLEERLSAIEEKLTSKESSPSATVGKIDGPANATPIDAREIELYPSPGSPEGKTILPSAPAFGGDPFRQSPKATGPHIVSFPVVATPEEDGVVLPSGSYVKGKVLTGVDVPEGKTYPVLMVLDFSYVAPNDHRVDLSGCFMIAKAEGDLSTERVQMQATKMSCVSKRGKMFEREVNGFIADDKDGSFAMKGKVNSKQGRVASMAFLASVVEGVGRAVQAAQTTQSTNALGGSQSLLTGDAGKYAVAGGAANAASMVAQWYLQQAQSLAPTVEVGSGRDVWIVIKDKVSLPEEFFKKERGARDEGIYSYFSRILD